MIYGIGLDLIEIERIEKVYNKQKQKFVERILSKEEQIKFNGFSQQKERLSILQEIATKEAFSKARNWFRENYCIS